MAALIPLIRLSTSIVELDLSCNSFGPSGCEQLRRAVEQNSSLQVRGKIWEYEEDVGSPRLQHAIYEVTT